MTDPPPKTPDDAADSGRLSIHGMPSPKRKVGRYEVLRQVGRGGMATVYLARQTQLERNVALKELSSFHASAPEFAERFLRESRLAGSLNHPNIVTVFEYFEEEGTPYIAMEYVTHGSLRPYVGRLSLPQFAGVMEGVLAGLAHAESYGIVHRDLKPENIMVTRDGRVKITDFGIAKATQRAGTGAFLTATGTTVGTPTYMAPEQAMAQDIGIWTDLYSVGVMAWEHVVGRVPFHDTEAPMMILMRHVNEPIPGAVDVNPDIDAELSGWIDRLLVKDPHERTQTAVGAWDELEEIVLRLLGPRWRRQARLPEHITVLDTPRPLTPAPFQSTRAPTPPPIAQPPVKSEPAVASPTPPESAGPTPGQPMPAQPTPAQPTPAASAQAPPASPPAQTPPPISTPTEIDEAYVTYGGAAEPAAPEDAPAATPTRDTGTAPPAGPGVAPPEEEATPGFKTAAAGAAAAAAAAAAAGAAAGVSAHPQAVPAEAPAEQTTPDRAGQAQTAAPEQPEPETDDYMTFGQAPPQAEPAPATPAAEPRHEPAPAADAAAPADAPAPAYPPGPAPAPATGEDSDYLTFGRTPGPAAPPPPPPLTPAPPAPPEPAQESQPVARQPPAPAPPAPPPVVPEPEPEPDAEPELEPAAAGAESHGETLAGATALRRPDHETRTRPAATRKRDHAPTAQQKTRRRVAAVALLGVVIAAVVGFLIAPSKKNSSTPAAAPLVGSVSSGPLQVSLPSGWSHADASALKQLPLANQLAASSSTPADGGKLVMGSATTTDPTLLPGKFLSALPNAPTPQTVTLGKTQFLRYPNLTPRGQNSPVTVYTVPTTVGTVIAVCQPQAAATTFMSNCERVVGSLQLAKGSVLPLGPSSSYGARLSAAIGKLNSQQSRAAAQLSRAKKPGDQAKAAGSLAAAYRQAAASVKKLQAGQATATNAAIAAALTRTATGYGALQHAASHNDGKGYTAARNTISGALSDLSGRMSQLSKLGYQAA